MRETRPPSTTDPNRWMPYCYVEPVAAEGIEQEVRSKSNIFKYLCHDINHLALVFSNNIHNLKKMIRELLKTGFIVK